MLELSPRWVLAVAAVLLGCQPDIGDSCSTNADCSLTGDRLCDVTSPGGYCTQFNCLPGKCPDEAACVGFYSRLSNACDDALPEQRFERSFCMKKCTSDGDCRESEGYKCQAAPSEVNAVVLEEGEAATTRVCMAALKLPKKSGDAPASEPAICSAPDASFPDAAPAQDAAPDGVLPDARSVDAGEADVVSDAAEGGSHADIGVRDARSEG
jgi:hypothetical protein